jgi:Ca-activated chloride channel homolog
MRFLRLDLLTWWDLLPVLIACWAVNYYYGRRVRRAAAIAPRFAPLSRRSTWRHDAAVLAASLAMAGALVVALLRPQIVRAERTPDYERQDLIVMLDRSASMRASDIKPSRFSRATLEIQNFLQHKPEEIDRIGLVGFANSSLILSYLTTDVDPELFYLDWADRDPQTLLGTDLGAALRSAREVALKDKRNTAKIFIVVSDGEDYGTALDQELAVFRIQGLRVSCIGIGTDRDVPVPVTGPDGRQTPLRDLNGKIVMAQFRESTLHRIAADTGGRYIRSTTGAEMGKAIGDIVKGERRMLGWRQTEEYHDVYPAALSVAAGAGAILWLLL